MSYINIHRLQIETVVDFKDTKTNQPNTSDRYSECPFTIDSQVDGEAPTQV